MHKLAMCSANNKAALSLGLVICLFGVCLGAVYNVGDTVGWTSVGGVDYNNWAASKNFQLGDSIVFNYNPKFHNVKQVDSNAYQACDASRPIASLASGNDKFMLTNPGTFFFICGVPGHCSNGLKMALNVIGSAPQTRPQTPPPPPSTYQTPPQTPPPPPSTYQTPPQTPPPPSTYQTPPDCPPGGSQSHPAGSGGSPLPPGFQYPPAAFNLYPFGNQMNAAAELHYSSYKLACLFLALIAL
ncbi:hypothetical protein HS088_TW17G00040 [Tripterygium wilfordii]|uniref:Phytocyanin domain-containing protein n=1 Tax=Tripterygium wilfordii TaxID=458696 RepID=A0A7J7CEF2_TRIWF|nr:hypothetical protein HS088_TW17G00040 [Tripterygium wilfordii]